MNHLSFNVVSRRWTFRPGLLEVWAKGPLRHSNQHLEARTADQGWLDFKGMWQAFKINWYFLLLFAWSVFFSSHWLFTAFFFFPSMLQHPHNAHRLKCGLGCHSLPQKAFCIDVTCSHEKEGSMFQTVFLSTAYHSSSSNPNKKIHQHLLQMCPDPLKKTWFLCFTHRAVLKWQRDFCSTLKFSIGYNNYATQDKWQHIPTAALLIALYPAQG